MILKLNSITRELDNLLNSEGPLLSVLKNDAGQIFLKIKKDSSNEYLLKEVKLDLLRYYLNGSIDLEKLFLSDFDAFLINKKILKTKSKLIAEYRKIDEQEKVELSQDLALGNRMFPDITSSMKLETNIEKIICAINSIE